ncbi:MAG TPA: cobalamin-binding protein [Nitrospiraceae bacterium]|nr:cobalamin-binding protein [Nitrospiraceae bacterium]
MKICSLLPGATEVVAALGLTNDLFGISHECDYPPDVRHKPVMVRATIDFESTASREIDQQVRTAAHQGRSLYALDEALFRRVQPDLVIAQDLCHVCAVTPDQLQQALRALPSPSETLALNPTRLDHVLVDIARIGAATGKESEAQALIASLRRRLGLIREHVARAARRPRVACLEWLDPLFAAGHWVPDMVAWAGGHDVLGAEGAPSERITWERLVSADPEIIVLMPCGFSIARTLHELSSLVSHSEWGRLPAVRNQRVFAVEAGAFFSRPGPRLIDGVALLAALCHPLVFGEAAPLGAHRLNEG